MLAWIFRHPKSAVVLLSGFVTVICTPAFLAVWGFTLTTTKTNAAMPIVQADLAKIKEERAVDNERWMIVQRSLDRIEERNYQELKEERQRRLRSP